MRRIFIFFNFVVIKVSDSGTGHAIYMKQIFANQIDSKMLNYSFDASSMLSIPDKALLFMLFSTMVNQQPAYCERTQDE